jgi:hypothetical protein
MRRRIHVSHMRRRIHVSHMRRRIHVWSLRNELGGCGFSLVKGEGLV